MNRVNTYLHKKLAANVVTHARHTPQTLTPNAKSMPPCKHGIWRITRP